MQEKNVFSFRVETSLDLDRIGDLAEKRGLDLHMRKGVTEPGAGLRVELESSAPMASVVKLLSDVPDAHVAVDTLRPVPLAQNSMERDGPYSEFPRDFGRVPAKERVDGSYEMRLVSFAHLDIPSLSAQSRQVVSESILLTGISRKDVSDQAEQVLRVAQEKGLGLGAAKAEVDQAKVQSKERGR